MFAVFASVQHRDSNSAWCHSGTHLGDSHKSRFHGNELRNIRILKKIQLFCTGNRYSVSSKSVTYVFELGLPFQTTIHLIRGQGHCQRSGSNEILEVFTCFWWNHVKFVAPVSIQHKITVIFQFRKFLQLISFNLMYDTPTLRLE